MAAQSAESPGVSPFIAFNVADIDGTMASLEADVVACESVRVDVLTVCAHRQEIHFFTDPDRLSLELYET